LNSGTRFLLPALPFLALAMTLAIPRRLLTAVVVVHAVLGWPQVMELYTKPHSWRLRGFPWQAALRVEPQEDYLRRVLPEYEAARILNHRVGPGERVLDLVGAPLAYTRAVPLSPWQHVSAGRAADAMEIASHPDSRLLYVAHASWTSPPLRGLRIAQTAGGAENWSIQEIHLFNGDEKLFPRRDWKLWARPNIWESHLALDRNPVTRWSAWQARDPGMYFEVEFPGPQPLTRIELLCLRTEAEAHIRLVGRGNDGSWRALPAIPLRKAAVQLNYRAWAARAVRREGFGYILTRDDNEGYGLVGRDLVHNPRDWGVEALENSGKLHLFRVQ